MLAAFFVIAGSSAISTLMLMGVVLVLPLLYLVNFYLRCKHYQAATPWPVQDKVVVITGASSGIGEELAYDFARQGATLILCARRMDKLAIVSKTCKEKYGATKVSIYKTDVSRESDVIRLIETIQASYDKIDCLVLNAGASMGETFSDLEDLEVIKNLMDVNFYGATNMTFHALPLLKNAEKPRIAVVSSLIAIVPQVPLRTGYIASKCAVTGFFKSLQAELIDQNIFISISHPGIVATEINKNRLGKNPKYHTNFDYSMSSEECAKLIIDGVIKGHREVILTNGGRMGRILEGIFPELVFQASYKRSKEYIGKDKCV